VTISITFTGRNAPDVQAWLGAPDGTSHFVTKSATAPTGGQAWRFVRGGQAWPNGTAAAVHDPESGEWLPVARGDTIVRARSGKITVLRPAAPR
jgi:hypothetical protein